MAFERHGLKALSCEMTNALESNLQGRMKILGTLKCSIQQIVSDGLIHPFGRDGA